jgi:hypothetical protein
MSVIVTVSNRANLIKAQNILGAKNESETVDIALERIVREFKPEEASTDLPDDYFEDLLAEKTNLSNGESIQAIIKEREESNF